MKNYDLGTEKIGLLVRHFSVPCVISMMVAALYNIVDQIFIGWSPAGAFGNAATNIVYPFTVLALGLSLLVGDGAAANFSLESGRKNKDRADGSPKYAMACTLAGAIANLILDPLFIFAFNMGVKGAAIATVIGQALTFVMSMTYLFRAKNFKISKKSLHLETSILSRIILIGMASLIVQLSIVVIIAVNNNLLSKYGYETFSSTGMSFGSVISLAVVGIVMKVFGIVVSIVIGISLGGHPIIGFSMGAGNVERVKETINTITKIVLSVGSLFFLIFELAPDFVISLFGKNNSPEYTEYARLCVRIFLSGIILTCFIKSAAIMLQSLGKSGKSTLLALLRDVIVFVPSSIILAFVSHNIVTMLWASLISDVISFIFAVAFIMAETRKITQELSIRTNVEF